MTNQQILEKAIAKAEKNGWDKLNSSIMLDLNGDFNHYHYQCYGFNREGFWRWLTNKAYKLLLTDHEFCKAFFQPPNKGFDYSAKIVSETEGACVGEYWQSCLQCMVITDNWLEYISKYLED